MQQYDELTDAQKAWILYNKITELHQILRENYHVEFLRYEKLEKEKTRYEQQLPF